MDIITATQLSLNIHDDHHITLFTIIIVITYIFFFIIDYSWLSSASLIL